MREKTYIGSKEIKIAKEIDSDEGKVVRTIFRDGSNLELNKKLFELVKSDVQNEGTPQDMVMYRIAEKFVLEMADYGITYVEVARIVTNMTNLVHNSQDQAVGKKFGVKSALLIPISKTLD